ncbi:MAG TPA: efflux RND transporter permease subunit [Clostridia bacterium]|nr:efflux RND transporter permease subunit [Clostridia bacterium]
MEKFIKSVLSHRFVILLICLLLMAFGVFAYINIPKQEMPDIKAVYGYLQITAPGLGSNEIEERIAVPIEDIISRYPRVDNYSTVSADNACIVFIEMNLDDKDSEKTLGEIKEDVYNADLDESITEIDFVTDLDSAEVIYAVYGNVTDKDLENHAKGLAEALGRLDDVADVRVDSAYSEELVVKVNTEEIKRLSLTLSDIYGIIYANGVEIPMGTTETDMQQKSITVSGNYGSAAEVENLIIASGPEGMVRLSDIAEVMTRKPVDTKSYTFNGQPAAFVQVFFEENIDFTVLGDEIEDTRAEFEKTLPTGIAIGKMTFTPGYVKDQVDQVMSNLLICIMIVMGVVLIGLGPRNAAAIALTIPVTVLTTIGILYIIGSELQLMSIAGLIISIGILVDNSIVISEAVQHNLDIGDKREKACIKAVKDNYMPVLTSTLTTAVVFAALLFLPGIAGEVAFTLPLTILISIMLSYIVSITLTPALASMFFKAGKTMKRGKKAGHFAGIAMRWVYKAHIVPSIIAFIVLGGLVYLTIDKAEVDILPKTERSVAYINYEYKESGNREGVVQFASDIEEIVKAQEDIDDYAYSVGGDLPKFYISLRTLNNLPNVGRFYIEFDCEPSELDEYIKNLESDLAELDDRGIILVNRLELSTYAAPVQIVLSDGTYEELLVASRELYTEIQALGSFRYGELVAPDYKADITIDIDRDKAAQNGLTLLDVESQVTVAMNGIYGKLYNSGDSRMNLWVEPDDSTQKQLDELDIRTGDGRWIPLSEIAGINEGESLEYIRRYNGRPSVIIEAYNDKSSNTYELEADIAKLIDDQDSGLDAMYKGNNEIISESLSGLAVELIIAVILIFLIMYFQFKSMRQPLMVLTTIPLSFIGSLVAIILFKEKISITTLLGIAGLVGIVVNNGILLVEYINVRMQKGDSVRSSCVKAVTRRIRPIALASLTTILGIIPLALTGGDFFRPMAVTFMGGMMISALLVLIIVPGLYYITYRKRDKKNI